jgi:hypothetical protein
MPSNPEPTDAQQAAARMAVTTATVLSDDLTDAQEAVESASGRVEESGACGDTEHYKLLFGLSCACGSLHDCDLDDDLKRHLTSAAAHLRDAQRIAAEMLRNAEAADQSEEGQR